MSNISRWDFCYSFLKKHYLVPAKYAQKIFFGDFSANEKKPQDGTKRLEQPLWTNAQVKNQKLKLIPFTKKWLILPHHLLLQLYIRTRQESPKKLDSPLHFIYGALYNLGQASEKIHPFESKPTERHHIFIYIL